MRIERDRDVTLPKRLQREPRPDFVLLDSDESHLAKVPVRMILPLRLAHAGFSYGHIAEIMLRVPVGTVKSRINRARQKILRLRAIAATERQKAVA